MSTPTPDVQPEGNGYTATCSHCGKPMWNRSIAYVRARLNEHLKTCKKKGDPQ